MIIFNNNNNYSNNNNNNNDYNYYYYYYLFRYIAITVPVFNMKSCQYQKEKSYKTVCVR